MGWSRNTVDDKTWARVKDADVRDAVQGFGSRKQIDRQANVRANQKDPRRS